MGDDDGDDKAKKGRRRSCSAAGDKKPRLVSDDENCRSSEDLSNDDLALKALMNPAILQCIVKHLPTRCLPNLRSTCQLWNKTMMPEYRHRTMNGKFAFMTIDPTPTRLDSVLDKLKDSVALPWGAYEFKNVSMTARKTQCLLGKVCGVLSRLKLTLTSKHAVLPIERFRTLILEDCPVLAELNVTDSRACARRFWKSPLVVVPSAPTFNEEETQALTLPRLKRIYLDLDLNIKNAAAETSASFPLITDLFNAAINLEAVTINDVYTNGLILDILKQKQHLNRIKSIKLAEPVSISNLQALIELSGAGLKLKKLDLRKFLGDDCFIDPVGVTLLSQLLALQGPTLEKLTASLTDIRIGDDDNPHYKFHLPATVVMAELKWLKLEVEYAFSLPSNDSDLDDDDDDDNDNDEVAMDDNENDGAGAAADVDVVQEPPPMPDPNITFHSLATNFPNLTKLALMDMNWIRDSDSYADSKAAAAAQWAHLIAQLGPHSGVTDLSFYIYDEPSYLMDMAARFPNVTVLKLEFSTKLAPAVWCVWPKVEKMDITLVDAPDEYEDEGEGKEDLKLEVDSWITGIPVQSCKALMSTESAAAETEEGNKCVKKTVKKQNNWKEYKTGPGISDLHELREFNLHFGWLSNYVYVTDLSGYYGFLANPVEQSALRRIYISSGSDFSEECVAEVQAALGLHGDFVPYDKSSKETLQNYKPREISDISSADCVIC